MTTSARSDNQHHDRLALSSSSPSFLVISGGTGGNAICAAFGNSVTYVLPVSDNGGSSSEIIRVLGGPSIGDIRSRLVRLIPPASSGSPLGAIRRLLSYRLPSHTSEREARDEWREIVEGKSVLWAGIPLDRKEAIRGFLVYFENQLLIRAHKNFSFLNGSIGNYFLAAAQCFFRSLPSAIFLFSAMTNSQVNILPVIVTTHTVTITAKLETGENLVGQCEISHPVRSKTTLGHFLDNSVSAAPLSPIEDDGMAQAVTRRQNVVIEPQEKDSYTPLPARISRLHYSNPHGQEVYPNPNPAYLLSLSSTDVLVYSCGSLWTSIIPCLALRGVATVIAHSPTIRAKVLLLNAQNDRETEGYTAIDYIEAITRTLNTHYDIKPDERLNDATIATPVYPTSAFVTHLVYLQASTVPVDVEHITRTMGVTCIPVDVRDRDKTSTTPKFDAASVRHVLDGLSLDRCHDA